jgi:1-acyl-sn-glycerol-3-phosphate acyltransferase
MKVASLENLVAGFICFLAKLISGATVRLVSFQFDTRQRIYASNHTSHLDFVVIWSSLPHSLRTQTRPVAAKDYWDKGVLRRYLAAKVFNAILINREERQKSMEEIDIIIREMGSQYSLILFPEGTRGTGSKLGPFKSGIYYLCKKKPNLEVVPVYLENLNRILPKGEIFPVPFLGSVTFGPPMMLQENEGKKEFLSRLQEAILRLKA